MPEKSAIVNTYIFREMKTIIYFQSVIYNNVFAHGNI